MPDETRYAYPDDLARFVRERWVDGPAPAATVLERLFATCYQASQLREEGRAVTFRAILADAELPARGGPPESVQRLEFVRPVPFRARELRRLSVAADFSRSLIGVRADRDGRLEIWGLIHQGPRWLQDVVGGRGGSASLPPVPVVHVAGPGSIEVRKGLDLVGRLEGGQLSGTRLDVFESRWLPPMFQDLRDEQRRLHRAARRKAEARGERWADLDPELPRQIGERLLKRVVAVVRDARHGGTVVFVPSARADELGSDNPYADIKYRFAEAGTRQRFLDVVVAMLNRLARLHGHDGRRDPVGWSEFEASTDEEVADLDEALFEVAYLVAGLAAVDGAVVMNTRIEILGFGAEISGRLAPVTNVARALDLEGETAVEESAADEGTRHRSAYRLAGALPASVAVVISQDGRVYFVRDRNGRVTYWEHE